MPDKPANDNGDDPPENEFAEPTAEDMREVTDFLRRAGLPNGGSLEEIVDALMARQTPPALH